MIPKTGDAVLVTMNGRSVDALVLLASQNGHSLMLALDGPLGTSQGCYPDMMPLLRESDDAPYRDLIMGEEVQVEPLSATADGPRGPANVQNGRDAGPGDQPPACIGRTFGNESDALPCDVAECPACKPRRRT